MDDRVPPFSEWTSDPTIPRLTGMLFIRLRHDLPRTCTHAHTHTHRLLVDDHRTHTRRQWPCSGWRDSPIRQINCVRSGPWNSLRFPRPTAGHFTLDFSTEIAPLFTERSRLSVPIFSPCSINSLANLASHNENKQTTKLQYFLSVKYNV